METRLAENIRALRKERSLTQEQLSEVLGVTAGAVYKWEAKLSVPELELIVEMADFFDVSVDVLLGYKVRDNRLDETVKRLREYRRRKDRAGLQEAEKALKKYPHSFEIVNESAAIFCAFGVETGDRKLFLRALELAKQSLLLLPQNKDPEISEQTICGRIAKVYMGLGEEDKAIELWKAHNAGGMYNDKIGQTLADSENPEEAVPFLSEALVKNVAVLISTVSGYTNVFLKRGDHASCQAILNWAISLMLGLRKDDKANFLDKVCTVFLAALAGSQYLSGRNDEARESLRRAKKLAGFFDASPSYDESDIRFIKRIEGASAHDDVGATAMDAVMNVVNEFENEGLTALWNGVRMENENHE